MRQEFHSKKPIILIINDKNQDDYYIDLLQTDYKIIQSRPSLIITNLAIELSPSIILLEGNDYGYKLCELFKTSYATKDIPIIFNINNIKIFSPSKAILAGALDYIQKPLNHQLIKYKIDNYIHLSNSIKNLKIKANIAKELNPNTGLPGNNAIVQNIYHALRYANDSNVVYVDLDNFKAYNDQYGFGRGDLIIKMTCDIITKELESIEGFTFMGHIGGDDFVFIAPEKYIKQIAENIINTFDKEVVNYYSNKAQNDGFIISKARDGKTEKYPIMTISMGGVSLSNHDANTRFEKISDLCSEVKQLAKSKPCSYFYADKRHARNKVCHHPLLTNQCSIM